MTSLIFAASSFIDCSCSSFWMRNSKFSGLIWLTSLLALDCGVSGRLFGFQHSSEECVSPSEQVIMIFQKTVPNNTKNTEFHCQTKHVSDRRDENTVHLQIHRMMHTRCICRGGHWWGTSTLACMHTKRHISCSCISSAACGVAAMHCWAHLAAVVPPNCRTTSYLVAFITDYLSLALSAHWQLAMLVLWVTLWASELNKTKQ